MTKSFARAEFGAAKPYSNALASAAIQDGLEPVFDSAMTGAGFLEPPCSIEGFVPETKPVGFLFAERKSESCDRLFHIGTLGDLHRMPAGGTDTGDFASLQGGHLDWREVVDSNEPDGFEFRDGFWCALVRFILFDSRSPF